MSTALATTNNRTLIYHIKSNKPKTTAIIIIIITLLAGVYVWMNLLKRPALNYVQAKQQDMSPQVSVDGMVDSAQDLSLAFQSGGTVQQINVAAGDHVKAGQVLASLNPSSAAASAASAQAALSAAEAAYQKLVNGQTSANIAVSQSALSAAETALTNAQASQTTTAAQQKLLVQNALETLLNSNLAAVPGTNNSSTISPIISGTYTGTAQGQYVIKTYSTGTGLRFSATGLENADGQVSTAPVPLGTMGLYIQFPNGAVYPSDSWTITLPNNEGASYLANLNAYNAALQTQTQANTAAQSAVNTAQANLQNSQAGLALVQTPARPEDIAAAKAAVQNAQAQVQNASVNLSFNQIVAPVDGVITSVDTKVGQTVAGSTLAPGPDAVKMISDENFQIDAYVSEADIGKITAGDSASVTLDAYGTGTVFPATVLSIDPAATLQNGVTTYKTTLVFTQADPRILQGMNANVIISGQTVPNALSVPTTSILKQNNQNYVLTQSNNKVVLTPVTVGIVSLDGNSQILSGLNAGQEVAAFQK